jgi:hypothetical protein
MTITDDRASTPTPAAAPPSYVRRHPILAAFGVLSGLSLFSALWPLSAIVVGVAVAGHATGLDRAALHLAERFGVRIRASMHHGARPEPAPTAPAPAAPTPAPVAPHPSAPAPSTPRHEAHPPAVPSVRSHRVPRPQAPTNHRHEPARRPRTVERHAGSKIDGPGF